MAVLVGEPGGTELGALVCGQVWVCPVCAYALRTGRGREAGLLAAAHLREGGQVWAVTCELGELPEGGLTARWQLLSAAWRRVVSGAGWAAEGRRTRRAGLVWTPEVVWDDRCGWQPLLRVLVLDRPWRRELHQEALARWSAQWSAGAGTEGARVLWRPVTRADQAEKHIAAACDGTAGRDGSDGVLGPADLLALARRTGAERWWGLWQEYVRAATPAARGHRAPVTFSRGLRSAVLPGVAHATDAELVREAVRTPLPPMDGAAWRRLATDGELQLQVLDAALRGPAHLAWTLADHGLPMSAATTLMVA